MTASWHPFKLPVGIVIIARRNCPQCVSGQIRARLLLSYMGDAQPVCSSAIGYIDVGGVLILMPVSGMFGYSHFTGGFAGGQAEYVRVPYGDVNLLHLPDDVPDEKGLYLSDVLGTSWNAVVDTGVEKGDTVAIWGAGPIGQMAAEFSFFNGANRVILIDGGLGKWRLDFVKKILPNLETIEYTNLPKGESVASTLKKMCDGRGPDVAIECAAGEYTKGWAHYFERLMGMETDTSELLNEMITSVRGFGRCGVTGVYAGYVCGVFSMVRKFH